MDDDLDVLTLPEVARLFRTTPASLRNKIHRGILGPQDGLRYFGRKAFFLGRCPRGAHAHGQSRASMPQARQQAGRGGRHQ